MSTTLEVMYMNLPNKITLVRVFLIPAFLFFFLIEPLSETLNMWAVLVVFVTAAVTDAIDGYLARKLKLVTNFGKLMDPLADKLLVCSALIAFSAVGVLSVWITIALIAREFYVSGIRQLALEKGLVLEAIVSAKLKTITQIVLIIYIILPPPLNILVFEAGILILAAVTLLISVYSAVEYTTKSRAIW